METKRTMPLVAVQKQEKTLALDGKYVRLEPVRPKYFHDIVDWRNNGRVKRYVIQPFVLTEKLQKQWYEKYLTEAGHCMYVLVAKSTGIPFGTWGYINYDPIKKLCIGTHHLIGRDEYLGSPEYLEGGLVIHDHVFSNLHIKKCYVHIMNENTKVVSIMKKIGYTENTPAFFPEKLFMNGKELKEYVLTDEAYSFHRSNLANLLKTVEDFT